MKKAAKLSPDLVAIKGHAAPAIDAPTRASVAPAPIAADAPAAPESDPSDQPLNFRVKASFRREFKTYAAAHDLKLNELLRRGFDAYKKQQGE
jgi:hypothetical protein